MNQKNILILFLLIVTLPPSISAAACNPNDDYYVYGYWTPAGDTLYTGPGGFIDETNALGRGAGKQYLVFASNGKGQLYEVETNGNPALHPCDPNNPGAIATRNFIHISTGPTLPIAHHYGFYMDSTGIYYGVTSTGVSHWDFDWNPINDTLPGSISGYLQTFSRNSDTGDFWAGSSDRRIFRCKAGETNWSFVFQAINLGGNHHDGIAYANDSLFISDMTSDRVSQYRLDEQGDPIDPGNTPFNIFEYSASPHVEMMEFGPNQHIWIGGWGDYSIYEIGGGKLQQYLNKGPKVDLFIDADEGPAPFTVEFDGSGSNDQDGWISLWEWDFDLDGEPDLKGDNRLVSEANNVGVIPANDPGFTCGTGQDLNIWDTFYCKYPSLEASVDSWFANVENFKNNEGINTVEALISQKFDIYIGGGTAANKIKLIRNLTEFFREECIEQTYYEPPTECASSCELKPVDLRFDTGSCMTETGVKRILDLYDSPLSSYSSQIYQLSTNKGIDPAVALAFFAISSNYGRGFDKVNWTYMKPGDYTVQLTVYDNNMVSASDTAPIKVLVPPNRAPFAAFHAFPASGFADLEVEFDASPSFDPDGDNMGYLWDFDGDGMVDASGEKVSHLFTGKGKRTVKLVARDPDGLFSEATIDVDVYTRSGITEILVEETKEGEKSKVSVECTEALPLKVSLYKVEGNESVLLDGDIPYTCNSGNFMPIGPELEAGVYLVNAKTDQADCQNCIVSLYYVIKAPQSKVEAPEINPVLTILIAFAALIIIRKSGN